MKLLRTRFSLFRRPAAAADAYEAEVLFAGWVELPVLFRELQDSDMTRNDDGEIISA